MKLFEFAVKRPVAVTMLVLIVVLLGAVSYSKLGLDLFPEMEMPMLLIQTSYPGAGPEEVENQVTRALEGAVGTVNGIKNINSSSSRGNSMIMAEFAWGTDLNFATNQLRDRLDIYSAMLPAEADKPMIIKMDPTMMPIIQIVLSGNVDLAELTRFAEDTLQPQLERAQGVASVNLSGGVTEEIQITAEPQRLQAYGVSFDQVLNLLRMENRNVTGGIVEEGLREHAIRIVGQFAEISDIENLQVSSSSGGMVRLADVAKVEQTTKERTGYVFANGQPGIILSLMKQSDANLVQTSDGVQQALAEAEKNLPAGFEISIGFDQADFIRMALDNVVNSAVQGGILAILILFVFLRSLRSTVIIGVSIPISIVATFAMMYFTGVSLNMVSLGGLALGLGMIVDNSIVILENIYRFRQEGHSRIDAAIGASKEVAGAVIASTVTTIVVYVPIIFVEGISAQIFRPMALTITCALVASLAVSLLVVPMLSARLLKVEKPGQNRIFSGLNCFVEKILEGINNGYRRTLAVALRFKGWVVLLSLAMFVGSILLIPKVGMEFIPAQDTGQYSVSVSLPNGVALRETMQVAQQVEKIIATIPENEKLTYTVGSGGGGGMMGSGGSQTASFSGSLVPQAQRQRPLNEILDDIRSKLKEIPGATIEVTSSGAVVMGGTAVAINLKGDDLGLLGQVADAVAQRVKLVEGTREVKTSLKDGSPEVNVVVDRQKAAQYGLSSSAVSNAVASAVNGTVASQYKGQGKEMDIRIILDKQYRENLNDLAALTIASPSGALVPLGDVAQMQITVGPTAINRENQSRVVSVSSEVSGRDLASVSRDIQKAVSAMNLPAGIRVEYGGSNAEMVKSFSDLLLALVLAILLVYIVMAFQFEQLLYPLVIMFAVPPTLVGVVLSLYLTGRTISVPTLIGVIMLAGIVVNNAIVLVDYINTLRREQNMERTEAILLAGPTRLRPILMTSLTTILGMLPIAIGIGEGSELMAPMGTAVAGGLTFSTLITLFLVPCMYIYAENFSNRIRKLGRKIFKKSNQGAVL